MSDADGFLVGLRELTARVRSGGPTSDLIADVVRWFEDESWSDEDCEAIRDFLEACVGLVGSAPPRPGYRAPVKAESGTWHLDSQEEDGQSRLPGMDVPPQGRGGAS